MTDVRRASADDAAVLARLLWDFDTEFETEVDDVDVLQERFARILGLPWCSPSSPRTGPTRWASRS